MHIGVNYSIKEVLVWTKRDILLLTLTSSIVTILYEIFNFHWLSIPWLPIAMLGTAVAFMVGFKNNAAYDRAWEARKIWGAIVNYSRTWGIMVKDYVSNLNTEKELSEKEFHQIYLVLYNRHFAWLTALRFQLRENKLWEGINKQHNKEYKNKYFSVVEHEANLLDSLKPYLSKEEYELIITKSNKAAQIIALQSTHLRKLIENKYIEDYRHVELEKILAEFYNQQGASERIKNYPYPRQFATLSLWFIKIFVFLIPFGMLQEFTKLGSEFVWLTIPFSVLSGWVFTTMEKIGEATENPFEGSANDIPITAISRTIEIDLLEMINEPHQLKPIAAVNKIIT